MPVFKQADKTFAFFRFIRTYSKNGFAESARLTKRYV